MIGDKYKQLALTVGRNPSRTHPYTNDEALSKSLKASYTPTLYVDVENNSPLPYSLPSPVKLTALTRHLCVTYKPRRDGKFEDRPFVVFGGPITAPLRVRDFEHLTKLAPSSPNISFILNFYLISIKLFSIAKLNPFLPVYIQFDYFSYSNLICLKLRELNKDIYKESILTFRSDCEAADILYNNGLLIKREARKEAKV